jgi:ribosome maturation factor RimP
LDLRDFIHEILPAGLGIYEAHLRPAGKSWHFEIILDGLNHPSGAVSIDDCAEFSLNFSERLDNELLLKDPVSVWHGVFPSELTPENYSLQVSSAGAERKLRLPEDLERFKGLPLRVKYREDGIIQSELGVFDKIFQADENSDVYFCFREFKARKKKKKNAPVKKAARVTDCEIEIIKENLIQVNLYLDL